jgi:hypothetical protein
MRSQEKKDSAYNYRNNSSEQILMDTYPTEPKRVQLVNERKFGAGEGSRFVVKPVDKEARWDEHMPGKAL